MSYRAHTDEDTRGMLSVLKKESIAQLFSAVPAVLIEKKDLIEEPGLSEYEVLRKIREYAQRNKPLSSFNSFMGGGCYAGYMPSVVKHIALRPEFYTAYTPYQPEISQGILQSIYEYQSFICLLTGMQVTSASLYDGASATAEAVLMGLRVRPAKKILVAGNVHPDYRKVLASYLKPLGVRIETLPYHKEGFLDAAELQKKISPECSSIVLQTPNFFGILEDTEAIARIAKAEGVLVITAIANLLSLGMFPIPEGSADIVCGDGGVLGGSPYWGGDTFGFVAAQERFLRNLPGRIVGKTTDKNNNPCYVLTLQAREQHIRREQATSNICSNQALNALKAAVYLSVLGEEGFRKASYANFYNTHYLIESISKRFPREQIELCFSDRVFNEFVMMVKDKPVTAFYRQCEKRGVLPGLRLKPYFPSLKNAVLVCATETKSREELDEFITVMGEVL